jgi:NAD(P)-dependent dehydrogenase (short-subunit alcohol dehydrogenase family)
MVKVARQWPDRIWAVEGAAGIGRPIAQRLLADGERVLDQVPPSLPPGPLTAAAVAALVHAVWITFLCADSAQSSLVA